MQMPTLVTIALFAALLILNSGHCASLVVTESHPPQPIENAQVPSGVSDLLAAVPTMLSSVSVPLRQVKSKQNTITITGSKLVFAGGADKPTLVQTILSMIRNSEPKSGDGELTRGIMAVLEADGSDHESVVRKQIEALLECREHEKMLQKCVEALVEIAKMGETEGGDDTN